MTGTVLHSTNTRSLGKLGGLIRHMPWVAWLGLIGTIAIAGLPPLNGFVSEWLLLQAFLATPGLPSSYLSMLVPVGAAAFVLAGLLGIGAYGGYLWLLQQTGAVFGAQVSYTVTGMGVVWAMLLLGERYSGWVWAALALLFAGLFLVRPRGAPEAGHVRA